MSATQVGPHAGPAKQMRNALCDCGSGQKYKKCCGSLTGPVAGAGASLPPAQAAERQFQIGVKWLKSGQMGAAVEALLDAIRLDETHGEAFHALGSALLQTGRVAQATALLYQAAALRPDSAPIHRDLGAAYDRQDLHEQAIAAYRRAAELAPTLADVQLRLGQLYAQYCRMEEASDCLDRAADLKPKSAEACLYRSDAHMLRRDIPAAEHWARKAIAMAPASSAAQAGLAGLLYNQGRFDEAATWYEAALRLDPQSAMTWHGLVQCRKYSEADSASLDRMRAVLRRGDLASEARMAIHFALGKIYDDLGDTAQAMAQFDLAAKLRAIGPPFDRAGLAALVDRNIQHFTPDFFARDAVPATSDQTPLFIVGMYRSGTTLVEQIVSSHPDIAAGGELTIWAPMDLEPDPARGDFDPDRAPAAIAKYLSVLRAIGPSAARVTDKLPTNLFRLGAIQALLPQARIIHCQRDPIDTCLSIYSTLFATRLAFAARKADLVFYTQQYRRMMDHWRTVLPASNFLEIEYEKLITDREAETRRLIAFTGLDWDERCLRPEQNTRSIGTASAWQARQPVYATSLQRWRRYEPWLGELRQLLPT
jgi:Tfp pilus assembly protein PilF